MKLFVAGIATETNTFSPIFTSLTDFAVQRGRDSPAAGAAQAGFDLRGLWGVPAQSLGAAFVFSLMAWAQPSGITQRSAYESLRDEILQDLKAALPVDVVLLMLHGAMVAEGYDDCEEDIIQRVRALVGPTAVIGVELDLHCHLSASKIAAADVVVIYKEYPHVDVNERGRELFELAINTKLRRIRPSMALFDCRMIGLYPTTRQPLRGFVDDMSAAEHRPGVLSVSFGHGFQFADVPHVGAKMLVVTDNDPALANQIAEEFGRRAHELRHQIGFESISLPIEEALPRALASERTPVVVADQSDNIGGGAPGDATFALRWLLDHQATDIAIGIFHDPEVVAVAAQAGAGSSVKVCLGGKRGPFSGEPLGIEVRVMSVLCNHTHDLPQQSGPPIVFQAGTVVALHCRSIDIVVSSERCQCVNPSIFTELGIDFGHKRVLIPKSYQHFHGAFAPIAAEVIYMAGPGAVPPDPRQLHYRRLETGRLYPWTNEPLT